MKYISVIISLLLITSCSLSPNSSNNKINDLNKGTVLGLFDESTIDNKQIFHNIEEGTNYTPTVKITNLYSTSNTYRLFVLLDYQQNDFIIDDKSNSHLDLHLEPNETKEINIELLDIKKGRHDFLIVCVRDPDNHLDKKQFVPAPNAYISRRTTLVVGKDLSPPVDYKIFKDSEEIESADPFITKAGELPSVRNAVTLLKETETKNMNLNIPNKEEENTFAIVAFIAEKQLTIKHPYVKLTSSGQFTIPFSDHIDIPNTANNMFVLIAEDPYQQKNIERVDDVIFSNLISIKK